MTPLILTAIIVATYLLLLALKDLRTWNKANLGIPSLYTDIFMLMAFAFIPSPIEAKIFVGILSFLIGLVLIDLDFFKGESDLKALVGVGITMPNMLSFFIFVLLLSILKLLHIFYIRKVMKGDSKEMPILPHFLFAYLLSVPFFL